MSLHLFFNLQLLHSSRTHTLSRSITTTWEDQNFFLSVNYLFFLSASSFWRYCLQLWILVFFPTNNTVFDYHVFSSSNRNGTGYSSTFLTITLLQQNFMLVTIRLNHCHFLAVEFTIGQHWQFVQKAPSFLFPGLSNSEQFIPIIHSLHCPDTLNSTSS